MYVTIPNILTLLRIALTPGIIFCSLLGGWYAGVALLLFVCAAITDYYDGYLARIWGVQTDIGRFLDPLADKILILSLFMVFAMRGACPYWVVFILALREVTITGLRLWLRKTGSCLVTSQVGKWKTAAQLCTIFVLLLAQYMSWSCSGVGVQICIGMVLLLTIWSGFSYLYAHRAHIIISLIKCDKSH